MVVEGKTVDLLLHGRCVDKNAQQTFNIPARTYTTHIQLPIFFHLSQELVYQFFSRTYANLSSYYFLPK